METNESPGLPSSFTFVFNVHYICQGILHMPSLLKTNSHGWAWTNDLAVNSRTLYHWAT